MAMLARKGLSVLDKLEIIKLVMLMKSLPVILAVMSQ